MIESGMKESGVKESGMKEYEMIKSKKNGILLFFAGLKRIRNMYPPEMVRHFTSRDSLPPTAAPSP